MFSLNQIQEAHKKVKTGADFPQYAHELMIMGVTTYDTFVSDGHAVYFGNPEPIKSPAQHKILTVTESVNQEYFIKRLKIHQSGGTDYMTFCLDCAENGIEKWTLDMIAHTCTYYDSKGNTVIIEHFGK